MNNKSITVRKLMIKMGGKCNLSCPHCHCVPSQYQFNPLILNWIKDQNFDHIVFGGGEPLVYLYTMKQIINSLGNKFKYRFVTNGNLLSQDIVNWINDNNIQVMVSFDGSKGSRDSAIEPKWDLVAQIKNFGLSVCCFHGNMDFGQIALEIDNLKQKYSLNLSYPGALNFICFPHQTEYSPNTEITEEDVKTYIDQLQLQLSYFIYRVKQGEDINSMWFLQNAISKWLKPKTYDGFACFNENNLHLTLDGRFLLCPYDYSYVGNIITGIDWKKVHEYEPNRCKSCEIKHICKNTCIANITENECLIAKSMHKFLSENLPK